MRTVNMYKYEYWAKEKHSKQLVRRVTSSCYPNELSVKLFYKKALSVRKLDHTLQVMILLD